MSDKFYKVIMGMLKINVKVDVNPFNKKNKKVSF